MSQYSSSCKCGLSGGRKYIYFRLTCTIYYIYFVQVYGFLKYIVQLAGMREHEVCGPSDGRSYIEWRALFYCGSSEGRSYTECLLFLLLYDSIYCYGNSFLLYVEQVKQQLVRWDCFWQFLSDGYWACFWASAASSLLLVTTFGHWQQSVPGFAWWCEGGGNQRPSLTLYTVWICASAMAASCALPRHFSGFISCFHFCLYIFPYSVFVIFVYHNFVPSFGCFVFSSGHV